MKTLRQPINLVFLIQTVVVFLMAFGVWPRWLILPLSSLVAGFVLWADLETSTAFFIRSVPLFVAIPLTSYFDSFNIWRVASGLIFLKWLVKNRENLAQIKIKNFHKNYPLASWLIVFVLLALLSLLVAEDLFSGIKRIIYLVNLGLAPIVIYDLIKKNSALTKKFLHNILISGLIVAGVGIVQMISVYLMSLDAFIEFWGNTVQLGFYGWQWARTALEGNTWFAYFGNQLSLRIFSTFPDSHSFPLYLLMTIPALLTLALEKVFTATSKVIHMQGPTLQTDFRKIIHIRASWLILLLPVFYLLAILSGTRGIWLAILGPLLILPFFIRWTQKEKNPEGIVSRSYGASIFKYLGLLLIPFVILFTVAWPIMGSDQFGLSKGDNQILAKRIRSILDLDETSNNGRVIIWKKTIQSIVHHPLLGVGIGNFPTVLDQSTDLAKAGSSAHNLYLHIAAEIGLLGLLAALGILWLILKRAWLIFTNRNGVSSLGNPVSQSIYAAAFILYSLWILVYSLTDAVLFDERAFLILTINSAIILGLYKHSQPKEKPYMGQKRSL